MVMEDYVDEELDIMREQSEGDHAMSKGISIEDPIKDLNMTPVLRANENISLKEAIKLLDENNIGCIIADDKAGKAVGIFTERDVLKRVVAKGIDLDKATLKEHMTPDPETLNESDPIAFALNKMSAGSYRHIPVRQGDNVRFILSVKDIVDHISFTYRNSVLNLPPDLKQSTSQYGG